MATPNKTSLKARNGNAQSGIDKHVTAPVMIAGKRYTPAALKTVFQNHTAKIDAADALRKQWEDALQDAEDAAREAADVHQHLQAYVISQYGKSAHATLNDFGMRPKSVGTKTVRVKAAAVVKMRATRAARHTMGSVQKNAVKGNVTGVVVTPVATTVRIA